MIMSELASATLPPPEPQRLLQAVRQRQAVDVVVYYRQIDNTEVLVQVISDAGVQEDHLPIVMPRYASAETPIAYGYEPVIRQCLAFIGKNLPLPAAETSCSERTSVNSCS